MENYLLWEMAWNYLWEQIFHKDEKSLVVRQQGIL